MSFLAGAEKHDHSFAVTGFLQNSPITSIVTVSQNSTFKYHRNIPLNFPGILILQFSLTSRNIITYEQYRQLSLFVGTFIPSTRQLCSGAIFSSLLLFPVHAFREILLFNYKILSDSIQSITFNSTIKKISMFLILMM